MKTLHTHTHTHTKEYLCLMWWKSESGSFTRMDQVWRVFSSPRERPWWAASCSRGLCWSSWLLLRGREPGSCPADCGRTTPSTAAGPASAASARRKPADLQLNSPREARPPAPLGLLNDRWSTPHESRHTICVQSRELESRQTCVAGGRAWTQRLSAAIREVQHVTVWAFHCQTERHSSVCRPATAPTQMQEDQWSAQTRPNRHERWKNAPYGKCMMRWRDDATFSSSIGSISDLNSGCEIIEF